MMCYSRPKLSDFYTLSPYLKLNWLKTMLFSVTHTCIYPIYLPTEKSFISLYKDSDGSMSQILFTDVKIIYLFFVLNYRNRGKSIKKVPSLKRDLDARALSESYR